MIYLQTANINYPRSLAAKGREEQKAIFEEVLSSSKLELIVVYAGRRVGKTYLVKQVLGKKIDFEMAGI